LTDPDIAECPRCGVTVPARAYCASCGEPLRAGANATPGRRSYAAAPGERVIALALVSTLFPHLARRDMDSFRLALFGAAVLLVALVLVGLHPVALVAAAFVIPLLMALYIIAVDLYEDEPRLVILATVAWGVVAGLVVGLLIRRFVPADPAIVLGPGGSNVLRVAPLVARGVVLTLAEAAVMIAGPLVLLRHRKFNDVLDGATFAMIAAASYVGARLLTDAVPLLSTGLQPGGATLPWVLRVLSAGILTPVLAGGLMGGVGGALWLRYRAPVRDRGALGPMGQPVVAALVAAAGFVVAAVARLALPQGAAATVLAVVAILAVLWLRRVIHVGLVEEAIEAVETGHLLCANCGRSTSRGRFCGECGVALRALPKGRSPRSRMPDQTEVPR
jgi:ribosomal protein L32